MLDEALAVGEDAEKGFLDNWGTAGLLGTGAMRAGPIVGGGNLMARGARSIQSAGKGRTVFERAHAKG
jgi:hypothetical protein